jgi:K+-sensing histidine kinase KdpD
VLLGEARELGAEVVRLEHRDVVAALVAFAADHAVRHVVLGRSRHRGWRLRADVIGRLLDRIPDADVHVIACAADRPAEAAATASRARVPEEVG